MPLRDSDRGIASVWPARTVTDTSAKGWSMGASGLWTVTSVPTTPSWLMTREAMVSARVSMRSTAVPVRTAMASSAMSA